MKKYSIGDFSKFLGVTPDFLKYYEKCGILQPYVNESGYRFYHFWERGQVLECIKLRNCGFSSKEVVDLLNAASLEDYLNKIHERQLHLQIQLQHLQAQMVAFDSLSHFSPYFDSASNWEVVNDDAFYFLPHADYDSFENSPSVRAAVNDWIPWLPIVQSAIQYTNQFDQDLKTQKPFLGFAVGEAFAKKYGLYIDSPVEYIPPQRYLVIYLKDKTLRPQEHLQAAGRQEVPERRGEHVQIAKEIMREHHFTPCGSHYYILKLLQLRENNMQTNYSIMKIPIN